MSIKHFESVICDDLSEVLERRPGAESGPLEKVYPTDWIGVGERRSTRHEPRAGLLRREGIWLQWGG